MIHHCNWCEKTYKSVGARRAHEKEKHFKDFEIKENLLKKVGLSEKNVATILDLPYVNRVE
jgi:hypothetical protein